MILLSGFTNSALLAVFAIYLAISFVVFMLMMALLNQFTGFKRFLQDQKAKSHARYTWTLIALFIASFALLSGILYIRYLLLNRGLFE